MSSDTFKAFYVEETQKGEFESGVQQVPFSFLPDHDILVRVHYSSLNYKDALSASGNKGVTRNYPHIPGIDASGVVEEDPSGRYKQGDKVIVTGHDLGSNTPGGYGEYIRVPEDWVVSLPDGLSLEDAMVYGTAGFTAMYGVFRLEREHIKPEGGKVLVTGATGGVGSFSVLFLSSLGYEVVAATGKPEQSDFLKTLGAKEVIHRDEITNVSDGLMLSRKWNAAIETVGGSMLDAVLRQINTEGAVACCGNILGHDLSTNIYPFILRGISLLGIDSAICKMPLRLKIWDRMAKLNVSRLPEKYYKIVTVEKLKKEIDLILEGGQTGRVLVSHPQN